MDTEIRPREPNEKQKAAAYDRFMEWASSVRGDDEYGRAIHWTTIVLRDHAISAPNGSEEG